MMLQWVKRFRWVPVGVLVLLGAGEIRAETGQAVDAAWSVCLQPNLAMTAARITVEATSGTGQVSHAGVEMFREAGSWIFREVETGHLWRSGPAGQLERADSRDGPWHRIADGAATLPAWQRDLVLLIPDRIAVTRYRIRSDREMAGKRYLTLVADGLRPEDTGGYGRISLSVTRQGSACSLLRAVYFDAEGKVWKKVFYHGQTVQGQTVWKNIHVEDTRTLERTVYRFSKIRLD